MLSMMPHPFASGHRRMTNCTSAMLDDGTAPTPYRQFDCNPSDVALNYGDGCQTHDCAHPVWSDGCEACMCFNPANAAWCDGLEGDYYDKYFEEHGENPFGDNNRSNRKCNTHFSPVDASCQWNWECESGLAGCYLFFPTGCKKCCREAYFDVFFSGYYCIS